MDNEGLDLSGEHRLILPVILGIMTKHPNGTKVFQPGFLILSPVDIMPYCGAGLGIVGGLEAFLASTHQMAVVSHLTQCDKQNCHHTLPNVP